MDNIITFESFENESIKIEYASFITSQKGLDWIQRCVSNGMDGDFGDYLYDFYPEYLM